MELKSMTVLVTGSAAGIGKAIGLGFLGEGARLVAVDRDLKGLKDLAENGALTYEADVSISGQAEAMIRFAVEKTGRLDVLINNAGIAINAQVADHEPDQFENLVRINLFGPFYGMRAAILVMREQGFGRIINLLSRNAEMGLAGMSAYSSSKAGLLALTRNAAVEVLGSNILINGLIPGPTRTGMNPFGTQEADVVYPTARMLALFPENGPTGRVFWDEKEYRLFDPENQTSNLFVRDPDTRTVKPIDMTDFEMEG
jgi:3-oxoacyl-[acyl-carrier protein] reductase